MRKITMLGILLTVLVFVLPDFLLNILYVIYYPPDYSVSDPEIVVPAMDMIVAYQESFTTIGGMVMGLFWLIWFFMKVGIKK